MHSQRVNINNNNQANQQGNQNFRQLSINNFFTPPLRNAIFIRDHEHSTDESDSDVVFLSQDDQRTTNNEYESQPDEEEEMILITEEEEGYSEFSEEEEEEYVNLFNYPFHHPFHHLFNHQQNYQEVETEQESEKENDDDVQIIEMKPKSAQENQQEIEKIVRNPIELRKILGKLREVNPFDSIFDEFFEKPKTEENQE
ncbi:hypothetical protein TRFO_36809 [Tritrichomonas foetus]|uniref:Uncharacterized protein n=1 Tax=Tritrichomonas foetus TaxID=1144522 RepID=A0A1J4JIK2_9EUKA|nr:hypothetical protein TRFO_36809 [Tritrichomonas foetus]|eukprot:OHS97028.1 hypothetical protein TRFO_36809 [Tritrichomonas foetus]